ncbi:MAG: alpha-L-fucosidase [Mycobacteriales bacterium]
MEKPRRRDVLKLMAAAGAGSAFPLALTGPAASAHALKRGNRYRLQKALVDRRFGMFLHFNMGTFHDAEWVDPGQDPMSFAPTALDCGQWADAAAAAGMTFAVLTTKHHDGFCLWPSRYSSYTVANSGYRHDIVRRYVDAFRARGVTPCLYFSIWDRTVGVEAPVSRADIDFVKNQLTELLTRYGPVPMLITDGWSWAMGHQQVPYGEIREHVLSLQPDLLFLDLNGVSEAWDSDLVLYEEPKPGQFAPAGNTVAATQGQTITPGQWFWHPGTPTAPLLSADDIVTGHLRPLEQRYTTFILNTPPNPRGLLDDSIVARLREVGPLWTPNRTRPPLPPQPDVLLHPVTPVTATATSGDASLAVDGHNDWAWSQNADQTLWRTTDPLPQSITLDLGALHHGLDTLTYLPRQDLDATGRYVTEGDITAYRVSVSATGQCFRTVAAGTWAADKHVKRARFRSATARYVRLEALAAAGTYAAASEFGVGRTG